MHRIKRAIISGTFFLAVVLVPFFAGTATAPVTAIIWVLSAFASSVSNLVFLSMMADAVPAERRTQMVGWRLAAFGLTNTLTILVAGPLLQRVPFPLNYQVMFVVSFGFVMLSLWEVMRVRVPEYFPPPPRSTGAVSPWRSPAVAFLPSAPT
mgnify:CR=1 FL=1